MKYFMETDCPDNGVFTLDDFKMMVGDDIEEVELSEMKRDYGGEKWCRENEDIIEEGDCGCLCQQYNPCNGKNGRCRNLQNGFVETGKYFILTKDGLKEAKK